MLERLNALLAGRYSVERELGRGGMASVWLARDLLHERPVALKLLHPELAGAIGVDRFVREIRLTARLQHPNIVPVLSRGSGGAPGARAGARRPFPRHRGVRRRAPEPRAGGATLLAVIAGTAWLAGRRPGAARVTRDPEVVALYRSGMHHDRRTPAGIGQAVKAFEAAVRRDSTYAEAWAGLAKTYVSAYGRRFVFPGVARDGVLRLAVTAVDRALALDPRSADAWVTQAIVSRSIDPTDVTPAIRALREALALDSASAPAWHFLALGLAESGELGQAMDAWRRGARADPSYTQGLAFLALGHYWRREYDSAQRWADSAVGLEPSYLRGRTAAASVALERRDFVRARAGFEAARRLSTDVEVLNAIAEIAMVEARAGAPGEAREMLQRAESLAVSYVPLPLHTVIFLAEAYAALGDADRAIGWLRRYAPGQDLHFQLHLRCDPPFDPVESDPRFRSLLMVPRPARPSGC